MDQAGSDGGAAEPAGPAGPAAPARWVGAVAAVAVVAALVGGGLVLAGTSGGGGDASASATCASGRDLIATTHDTASRDDERFLMGYLSVAITGPDGSEASYLNDPEQVVSQPSFSPDGRHVAVRLADGDYESAGPGSESIWVYDMASGNARPLTFGRYDSAPAYSPDGTEIAYLHFDGYDEPEEVRVVPANGGPHRTVATETIDLSYDSALAWLPDGSIVLWATSDRETRIVTIPPDGSSRTVTTLASLVTDATVVPGGEELLALTTTSTLAPRKLVAIDLADGSTRTIGGDSGSAHWSLDGQRLYLAEPVREGPPTIRRARYDGSAIEAYGEAVTDLSSDEFTVGPCVVADDPSDPSAKGMNDQPLIGTDWRIGPASLTATSADVAGCSGPDCQGVTLQFSCLSVTGALRGTELTEAEVPTTDANSECADPDGWDGVTVSTVEITGDIVHLGLSHDEFGDYGRRAYGAAYVGEPPAPIRAPDVDGPAIEEVTATTTTMAAPMVADCDLVHSWGDRLAASSATFEFDWVEEPVIVADNSDLVVTGQLLNTGVDRIDGHQETDGSSFLLYTMVVDEVLVGHANDDPGPGSLIEVTIRYGNDADRPPPPALGEWGSSGPGPEIPEGEGVPVVAFLDIPDGALAGEWTVTRPAGLAVGCPGRPMTGLIGTGVGWDDLGDIDALAEVVRSN